MKNVLKFCLVSLLSLGAFSCSTNEDIIPEKENQIAAAPERVVAYLTNLGNTATSTNQDSDFFDSSADCFSLDYPFSLVTGDGTTTSVNNETEYIDLLSTVTDSLQYVFPLNATFEGNAVVINDESEFFDRLDSCYQFEESSGVCFTLNFPLQIQDDNGDVTTLNNEQELANTEWAVGFVFPISVTLEDSTVLTVNDDQEFDALYNDCFGIETCEDCTPSCFVITYPINLVSDTGAVTTLNNDEEIATFFDNLDEDDFFNLTYPLTLEYDSGTTTTVNSDEEFETEIENCN